MLIRRMTKDDIEEVATIEANNFSQPWSENAFQKAMESPDNILLVAQEEDKILAYACMYVSFDEGEITNVAVSEDYRGRGIGSQIMTAVFEQALQKQINRIILEVRVSNLPAIALYRKTGFVELGIRKGFYDLPKEDAYIMERSF